MSAVARDAARLILQQRWAALATLHEGSPSASMVAYACEPDLGGLLLFLSGLAAHTRDLVASPAAALAVSVPDTGDGDPQLLPRVALRGSVWGLRREDDEFAMAGALYVQRFPGALPRFELGDFMLFRFVIDEARYVGGFALAATFTGEELRTAARADATTNSPGTS